LILPLNKK